MGVTVELPLWLFLLILLFAAVTAASHLLFPSVRWFFRRRMERAVARLNTRLDRPIEPFKLARRHDMIQRLIYQPEVTRAVVEHAAEEGIPENVAFEEAKRYAREIVPSFSATAYFGVAIRLARFLSTALYHVKLTRFNDKRLEDISGESTIVFVMNHRSNMDYVLVTYLAAQRSALAYAVGEWARVWPLSRLIRAMGAYFIRRKSRNALYRRVLAAYVRLATEGGVTQAMFPEGRLSLNGAPQEPKRGLLKYITDGFDPDGRDVVFVPVALNYDRVLEDRILLEAASRGGKGFRARISVILGFFLRHIWLRLRGKYHKFGIAAVSVGRPISLKGFVTRHEGDLADPLAEELMHRINEVVPVLPVPMVAAILEDADGPLTRPAIEAAFATWVVKLGQDRLHLPNDDLGAAVDAGLGMLVGRRIVTDTDGIFAVDPTQQPALAFYANSIRHLLE